MDLEAVGLRPAHEHALHAEDELAASGPTWTSSWRATSPTTAIAASRPGTREKKPDGRWRSFDYEELMKRDKANLDIFWLKDKSLEDSDDLPDPDVLAQEIADDLQTALGAVPGDRRGAEDLSQV